MEHSIDSAHLSCPAHKEEERELYVIHIANR